MVFSRDEYGAIKEKAAKMGKSDRFLEAAIEKPMFSSAYGKSKALITGESNTRRAALGAETTDGLETSSTDQSKTKRSLLG